MSKLWLISDCPLYTLDILRERQQRINKNIFQMKFNSYIEIYSHKNIFSREIL